MYQSVPQYCAYCASHECQVLWARRPDALWDGSHACRSPQAAWAVAANRGPVLNLRNVLEEEGRDSAPPPGSNSVVGPPQSQQVRPVAKEVQSVSFESENSASQRCCSRSLEVGSVGMVRSVSEHTSAHDSMTMCSLPFQSTLTAATVDPSIYASIDSTDHLVLGVTPVDPATV